MSPRALDPIAVVLFILRLAREMADGWDAGRLEKWLMVGTRVGIH